MTLPFGLDFVISANTAIQEMPEMGLGFLVGRMVSVGCQGFLALELRVQRLVHTALIGSSDLHLGKTGDHTHQRLQHAANDLDGFGLVDTLLQGVDNDMLYHMNSPLQYHFDNAVSPLGQLYALFRGQGL